MLSLKRESLNGRTADQRKVVHMTICLRQICLVSDKLGPAVKQLGQTFSLTPCHIDPAVEKFGLENTLFSIGTNFLEIVAPIRENTAAGRFLQKRGDNGGYMVICQARSRDEQSGIRQRAEGNNIRIAYENSFETWNIMQLHPADMGAAFLEVDWDQEEDITGNWEPAGGKNWKQKPSDSRANQITAIELQSTDPEKLGQHWAAVIGISLQSQNSILKLSLPNADIRFVKSDTGTADHLSAIDLKVKNIDQIREQAQQNQTLLNDNQVKICGTIFNLLH